MDTTMGWLLVSLLIAGLLARATMGYARRRGMLDQPGRRRSHQLATPRGGGVGIVLALLICLPGVLRSYAAPWPGYVIAALALALAVVAAAGWWDDHRALPVLPRLGAQSFAVLLFSGSLLATGLTAWWLPLLLLAGVWSVNFHNFMDGIDGLLAQQAIFVGVGLACLAWAAGQPAVAMGAGSLASAAAGFWYYNRSPARIFMGDVGSGSVGLLLFAFSAMLWRREPALVWPALILSSSLATDAALTLLTRIWFRRRWYNAHREHLYQWLVRCGLTHAQVGVGYLGWNLLIAVPLTWLAWRYPRMDLPLTIVAYVTAALLWLVLKRHCLRNPQRKARHVAA